MKKNCVNCDIKHTCLKRSLCIFLLYIQTGRVDELTEDIRKNFSCDADCDYWKQMQGGKPHNGTV